MTTVQGERIADQEVAPLVARARAEIAAGLAARLDSDEQARRPRMDPADQRVYARRLINDWLRALDREQIDLGLDRIPAAVEERIARAVLDALFGLGPLQQLLDDDEVENVVANGADQVWVTYADGTKTPGPPLASSDGELVELLRTAAARVGLSERRFDTGSPALNLELPDGSRVFAVMSVAHRPALAVRRHRYPRVRLADLAGLGMVDPTLHAFLAAAVRARLNIVVCGGTGAGKTTLLRALLNEVAPAERLVTIEDNLELGLHRHPDLHPDVVALEAREANLEGVGEVTMADLVRMGLRMSPDRVIVGEVRGAEVLPMLNAMSQGNDGSMCTIHADSSAGAFARIAMYAVQAPERLPLEATNLLVANAVDLVVFIAQHDTTSGRRRRVVASVREVVGADGPQVVSNEVFEPGPDGTSVPAAPLRPATMARLAAAGFDPTLLGRDRGWGR